MSLSTSSESVHFYNERYSDGYLQSWPRAKENRVLSVLQQLHLPQAGKSLDFGCGSGVFTRVLRQALPHWDLAGTDISTVALRDAEKLQPDCRFFSLPTNGFGGPQYDFLFSHHVLEHVPDISDTVALICSGMKAKSSMLHILPCGNSGSFEEQLCRRVKGGIDTTRENRFYFEDEAHLRRLTTEQLSRLFAKHGFALQLAYYANQFYGAIQWITECNKDWIRIFIDPSSALDTISYHKLYRLKRILLFINTLRRIPLVFFKGAEWRLSKDRLSLIDAAILLAGNPMSIVSFAAEFVIRQVVDREWRKRNRDPKGSEMYLYFTRS